MELILQVSLLFFLFNEILIDFGVHGGDWCYNKNDKTCGPNSDAWSGLCVTGQEQSPINLPAVPDTNWTTPTTPKATIYFNKIYKTGMNSVYITNNGHTVCLSATPDQTSVMTLRTSLFPGRYVFGQVHCHWASEHLLDSKRYPLECHFVHYNDKFNNIPDALMSGEQGSLLVFGVMYKYLVQPKSTFQNRPIQAFTKNMKMVKKGSGDPQFVGTYVNVFKMLVNHVDPKVGTVKKNPKKSIVLDVYSYKGSLTVPGCFEGLHWLVFKNPRTISLPQMNEFWSVVSNNKQKMRGNFRSPQPLNSRNVTAVRLHVEPS